MRVRDAKYSEEEHQKKRSLMQGEEKQVIAHTLEMIEAGGNDFMLDLEVSQHQPQPRPYSSPADNSRQPHTRPQS